MTAFLAWLDAHPEAHVAWWIVGCLLLAVLG